MNFIFTIKILHSVSEPLSLISLTNDNRTFEMTFFQNPRQSTAYIILQGKNTSIKIYHILNQLVNTSPIDMRPKCLVIFSDHQILPLDEAKNILRQAWLLKVLTNRKFLYMLYYPKVIIAMKTIKRLSQTVKLCTTVLLA